MTASRDEPFRPRLVASSETIFAVLKVDAVDAGLLCRLEDGVDVRARVPVVPGSIPIGATQPEREFVLSESQHLAPRASLGRASLAPAYVLYSSKVMAPNSSHLYCAMSSST